MNELAAGLLASVGRTTLLVVAAAGVVHVLLWRTRCSSPTIHRVAWFLVLAQGWLLLRVPVGIPCREAPPERSEMAAAPAVEIRSPPEPTGIPSIPVIHPMAAKSDSGRSGPAPASPVEALSDSAIAPPSLAGESALAPDGSLWPGVLLVAWLAGMALTPARWSIGYLWFVLRLPPGQPVEETWQREWQALLAEAGVRRRIPIRVTNGLGPMLCRLPAGWQLVLPAGLWRSLSPAARETVLRHELAHWRRGDGWKSLGVRLMALPHWFNPAAWWAVRRFEEAGEWACDQEAVGADRRQAACYARTLLCLGAPSNRCLSYGPGVRGRGLSVRVRRLVKSRSWEDSVMKRLIVIGVALGLAVVGLLRFELVAKETGAQSGVTDVVAGEASVEQPAQYKPGAKEPATTDDAPAGKSQAGEKPAPRLPLDVLRYDGKGFDEWREEWRTELKPERRAEAINAFAAFGANGYGQEAASAILEVIRQLEVTQSDGSFSAARFKKEKASGNELIKQSAMAAFLPVLPDYRIPPDAAVRALSKELREGNRSGRRFATFVLSNLGAEAKGAVDVLAEAVCKDRDPIVRQYAFPALAKIAPHSDAVLLALGHVVKDSDPQVIERALYTLVPHIGAPAESIFQEKRLPGSRRGPMSSGDYYPYYSVEARPRELRPDAGPVLQLLLDLLRRKDSPAQFEAVVAVMRFLPDDLESMGETVKEIEGLLWEIIQQGKDQRARVAAVMGVTRLVPDFHPRLVQSLDPGDLDDLALIVQVGKAMGPGAQKLFGPVLEKAAQHEDENVRQAARKALEAISGVRSRRGP